MSWWRPSWLSGSTGGGSVIDPATDARFAAGTQVQGLEAGATRRRLAVWQPSNEHVNALLRASGSTVLARARFLVRNNGYAKAAMRSWGAATVGAGIKPSPLILNEPELKAGITQAWADWTDEADAEGVTDFYGLCRRVSREAYLAGEVFIRFITPDPADGLSVPLQLQVMPAEQLPYWRSVPSPVVAGNEVRLGVEFDPRGRRVAYWFWKRNPSDVHLEFTAAVAATELVRVPAEEVLHVYDAVEAGQVRGLSSLAQAIVKMFMLDVYDDAELERKKQAARYATFITKPPLDPTLMEGEFAADDAGAAIGYYGPGATVELREGEDVKFSDPADVGGGYEPFQYRTLLQLSAALGVPYAELSADLNRTTYASSRAGLLAFRAEVEAFQHAVLVFQFLRPIYQRWLRLAVLAGAVPLSATEFLADRIALSRFKAIVPRAPWVDPLKDRQAAALAVANGYISRDDVIEAEGYDPEETDLRIKASNERAEALGLDFTPTSKVPADGTGGTPAPEPADQQPGGPADPQQREAA